MINANADTFSRFNMTSNPDSFLPSLGTNPATPGPNDEAKSSDATFLILVVDDDPTIRNLLAIMLQNAGYLVICADDGEAGWEAIQVHSFDLLITDHDMPRLSGLDLLRRIRAHKLVLPVILVSGKVPREVIDFSKLLHPGTAIEKPFTTAQFLTHVRANLAAKVQ